MRVNNRISCTPVWPMNWLWSFFVLQRNWALYLSLLEGYLHRRKRRTIGTCRRKTCVRWKGLEGQIYLHKPQVIHKVQMLEENYSHQVTQKQHRQLQLQQLGLSGMWKRNTSKLLCPVFIAQSVSTLKSSTKVHKPQSKGQRSRVQRIQRLGCGSRCRRAP